MNLRSIKILFAVLLAIPAEASDLYVSPDVVNNMTYSHNEDMFTGGTTAFATISEAIAKASEGTTIHIRPGTYAENITIDRPGIVLLGANAYCEERSGTRIQDESTLTGAISVNASHTVINGFRFTETAGVTGTLPSADAPITDFIFSFNTIEGLTRHDTALDSPMLKLGQVISGPEAMTELNNFRYADITITNNVFIGNGSSDLFVQLSNVFGHTDISDNTFSKAGQCIRITNTQDTVDIHHNRFNSVSAPIMLQYMGAYMVQMSICDNEFDHITPSAGEYPVTLDQGNGSAHVTAASPSSLTFSRNVIKHFSHPVTQASPYRYFLWADADVCLPIILDTRFNRCDNSEIAFGTANPLWESMAQRYFAGSTGLFDFDQATADYYVNPTGAKQHQYKLKTNAAAQSFDIDTETGDIYYIQVEGSGDGVLPLRVTRYLFRADKTTGRQYMYLTNASHGANMSVFRHKGKVWIATGGASIFEGHCKPQSSVLLPFVSGATADCGEGKTSFTHNDKTYEIIQFKNQWGKKGCYPAIDVDNRLFCESHTASSGKVRFAVYDLDDILANGSNARLIKAMIVQKGSNKYENPDPGYADIVDMDYGFSTSGWAMQGFDISGDMIYRHEGVGLHNDISYKYDGKSVPTIMQDCINWRDSVYVHRKPVLNPKILDAPNGEPEGVKIVRDADGRPHMIMGIVWGTPKQRSSTLVDFMPPSAGGQGFDYPIPTGVLSASTIPGAFFSSTLSPQSTTVKINIHGSIGHTTAVISGPDAECFTVGPVTRSGIYVLSDRFPVTFTPSGKKKTYKANLRVSAPHAADLLIPLTGSYSGQLSHIDGIRDDAHEAMITGYYDISGRRLHTPAKGINIVRYADGSARKIVIR